MIGGSDVEADSLEDKLEDEEHKDVNTKLIRILTVVGYVICVSSAGIVLSLYYLFLWDPYSSMSAPHTLASADRAVFAALTKECAEHIATARERDGVVREMSQMAVKSGGMVASVYGNEHLSRAIDHTSAVYSTR